VRGIPFRVIAVSTIREADRARRRPPRRAVPDLGDARDRVQRILDRATRRVRVYERRCSHVRAAIAGLQAHRP
jgi:hypothetical protein